MLLSIGKTGARWANQMYASSTLRTGAHFPAVSSKAAKAVGCNKGRKNAYITEQIESYCLHAFACFSCWSIAYRKKFDSLCGASCFSTLGDPGAIDAFRLGFSACHFTVVEIK